MHHPEERAIDRFRLHLGALLALRHALFALTVWAFLWGTIALALRAALGLPRPSLLFCLFTLPLALLPALVLAWRQRPPRSAVRAYLDQYAQCGGLLMAGESLSLDGWRSSLQTMELPRLRWRGRRAWALLGTGIMFLLLCFYMPSSLAGALPGPRLEIDRDVDSLAGQIDLLKEESALPPKRAEELKQELERLRHDASGKGPARTLEAMDHLRDTATRSAREAVASAGQQRDHLGKAAALADLLGKGFLPGNKGKSPAEDLRELARLVKFADKAGLLPRELQRAGLDRLLAGQSLSPEQLTNLARALESSKARLGERAQRLYAARLIDRETLARFQQAGPGEGAGGGRARGMPPAALTWKEESKPAGVTFKDQPLPPALAGLREHHASGSGAGPKVGGEAPARSGSLARARAGGGGADVPVVWPRHRGAVARYFDRPGPSGK